jgi:prepilin-type N-terminal cleavage/methylation domain-containing protein
MFRRAGGAARYGGVRRRKGFTLVEVIVVLVILAILAAIALPALTGYIDKANAKGIAMRVRTQVTAFQTMLDLQYAEEGGFTAYNYQDYNTSSEVYGRVQPEKIGDYPFYTFFWLTKHGLDEYQKLTGDMESFTNFNPGALSGGKIQDKDFQEIYADSAGVILFYTYRAQYYYNTSENPFLCVVYVPDIDSTNPVIQARIAAYFGDLAGAKALGVTSGINVFKYSAGKFEKLN